MTCSIQAPFESVEKTDLPVVAITMSRDDFADLLKSSYTKLRFPAEAQWNDTLYKAEIQLHGNVTVRYPKKSFDINLYKVVIGPDPYYSMTLSSQLTDLTFSRYRIASTLFRKAGFYCSGLQPVRLFFNNRYEGVYLMVEPVNEHFLQRRGLPVTSLYKANVGARLDYRDRVLPQQSFDKKVPEGDLSNTDLQTLIEIADKGITEETRPSLESILDITNALDYYAIARLINHSDGVRNNFFLYYNPLIHKFQFIPWDLTSTFFGTPFPHFSNGLFEQLERITSYKLYMHDRMRELFSPDSLNASLDTFFAQIHSAIREDPYMSRPDDIYLYETGAIREYIARTDSILKQDVF